MAARLVSKQMLNEEKKSWFIAVRMAQIEKEIIVSEEFSPQLKCFQILGDRLLGITSQF